MKGCVPDLPCGNFCFLDVVPVILFVIEPVEQRTGPICGYSRKSFRLLVVVLRFRSKIVFRISSSMQSYSDFLLSQNTVSLHTVSESRNVPS